MTLSRDARDNALDLTALVVLLGIAFATLHEAAAAGFVLVDDHEILSFTPGAEADPQLGQPPGLLQRVFVVDAASGRVRPLYWAIRYGESALFDANPHVWHMAYTALGVVSAILAYAALRRMGIARVAALMVALWLLVAPGVSTVWIRLGPQEPLGTFFLVLAVWCMAAGLRPGAATWWIWIFLASAIAMTLTKESFALVPPSLAGLWILLDRRLRWPPVLPVIAGLSVAAVAYTTARLSGASYGAGVLDASGADQATPSNLVVLVVQGGFLVPLLVLGLVVARLRGTPSRCTINWLLGALVAALLIVPQLVLYRGEPGFAIGRYVLPAGLGLVAGVAAGANWLRLAGLRVLYVFVVGLWVSLLLFGGLWTAYDAESFRIDSQALDDMLDSLVHQAPQGATIGLAVDPVAQQELAYSLPYHIAARGRPDVQTRVLSTTAAASADNCSELYAVVAFTDPARLGTRAPCVGASAPLVAYSANSDPLFFTPGAVHDLFPRITVTYWIMYPD